MWKKFDHGWYEMYEMTNCHDLVQDYYFEVVEFRLDHFKKIIFGTGTGTVSYVCTNFPYYY